MKSYRERIADRVLKVRLRRKGAVLIEGPKWCGKTTTARQHAAAVINLAHPAEWEQTHRLLEVNSDLLLQHPAPLLIDEWQTLPSLWDAVRCEVDQRGEQGQFILTGSAVPSGTERIAHTGTGRFSWMRMRPMSLFESGESDGSVRLSSLFEGEGPIQSTAKAQLQDIAYVLCRGGWPGALDMEQGDALAQAGDYVEAVVREDVSRVDGMKRGRNPQLVRQLMRAYARHQGTQVSLAKLRDDIREHDNGHISEDTMADYLAALRRIFVIEDVPAWNPNLRSQTAIRSTDTRYFSDPSIAAAALACSPNDLLRDLNTMGLLFETLCVRDLRCYGQVLEGELYHYRDKNGLECDAVLHLPNGSYGLIEIKLGGNDAIDKGAATLTKLAAEIDTRHMKAPSFMMVLTAVGPYAYRRPDGVAVVPISCLRD